MTTCRSTVLLLLASVLSTFAQNAGTSSAEVRARWNKVFEQGATGLKKEPNRLLVRSLSGRTPGKALDLGSGEGRNLLYLAEQGWRVTGVDLSEVAVEQTRRTADARKLKVAVQVANLDDYDFGQEQWDLITLFYMHGWQQRSKTDVPARILRALKPGGLLVMEAFAAPANPIGLKVADLQKAYEGLRILTAETLEDEPDWDKGSKRPIVRFVAEKPR